METKRLEDLSNINFDEELEDYSDKSKFQNYSKKTAITIGYLLGVRQEFLETLDEKIKVNEICDKLSNNRSAIAIRTLNNIRSNIILNFKRVSRTIRISSTDYQPIYKIDVFEDDFKALSKLDININTGRQDLNEYLIIINEEIQKHIDNIKPMFPEWINFKHIKHMFNMPTSKIKLESEKFQNNQNYYPFKRYFNWSQPEEKGNLLTTDVKILTEIYESNNDYFEDLSKVMDASDNIKNNINDFINKGNKIQIFVDGENCDPYRLAAMFDSLKDYEIQKIDKVVVYYDDVYSSKAWISLHLFTYGVEVEAIGVGRIKEDKSLVDHRLVGGVSKAVYKDNVDSIILASSDSDFWSVIDTVEANYLVLVESDKCSYDFKNVLREHNIFYCNLDRFMTPEDDDFFNVVFKKELEKVIEKSFSLGNAKELLHNALIQTRATVSPAQRDNLYNKVMKNLKLVIDKEGNYSIFIE